METPTPVSLLNTNLILKNSLFYVLFLICGNVFAQNSIRIINNSDSISVSSAVVYIQSLNNAASKKLYYPSAAGEIAFSETLPVSIEIIANGYKKYKDTLLQPKTVIILIPHFSSVKKLILTGGANLFEAENSVNRIIVIDQQKIKALAAQTLDEALANEINININQDAQLGAGLSLRGVAGQQVKILIDGIPMIGRNNGNIDLSQINMNNVEHIEIIEGPMSIIYGTDAAGGIINIISKQPNKSSKSLQFNQFASTRGVYNSNVNLALGNKKHQFGISATRYLFQGFDELKDVRNPLWRPKRQLIGDVFYNYYLNNNWKQSVQLNYFNEYLIAKGAPIIDHQHAQALDDYFTTNRFNIAGQTFYKNSKRQLFINITNAYNYYERTRDRRVTNLQNLEQTNSTLNDGNDLQKFETFNSRLIGNKHLNKNIKLGFGYDINLSKGESDRIIGNPSINEYALFYNIQYKYKKLSLEQGLRLSYNNQFSIPLIPALHLKYDLTKNWKVIGSYANGFRTPSLKERYLFFVDQNHDVTGNPNLQAETSNSGNLTFRFNKEGKRNDINMEVNGFYTEIKDLIVLAAAANNPNAFTYENIEQFYSTGVNAAININNKRVQSTVGFGWVGTKQITDSLSGSNNFLFAPSAQCNVSYYMPKWKIRISSLNKFNGAVPNYIKENSTLKLQFSTPFMMSDLTAMRTFAADKLNIALSIKNLFNITNIQNTNNIGGVHSAGANSAAIAMGRFLAININYTLGK